MYVCASVRLIKRRCDNLDNDKYNYKQLVQISVFGAGLDRVP